MNCGGTSLLTKARRSRFWFGAWAAATASALIDARSRELGRDVNGAAELIVAIRSKAPGEKVTLKVKGSTGAVRTVEITLGSQRAS